jgi:hypothetical protein
MYKITKRMSGKFTKTCYDPDAYDAAISRSTDALLYKLDPNYIINCNRCFSPYGPRGGNQAATVENIGDRTDIDSILRGIGKPMAKTDQAQAPLSLKKYTTSIPGITNCSGALDTEYSRYTNPSYDIRGLTIPDMRLDYPHHDPQCQIFENFAINTRLQAKDNHKTIWQEPLDQSKAFPQDKLSGPKKNCYITMNCSYAPY